MARCSRSTRAEIAGDSVEPPALGRAFERADRRRRVRSTASPRNRVTSSRNRSTPAPSSHSPSAAPEPPVAAAAPRSSSPTMARVLGRCGSVAARSRNARTSGSCQARRSHVGGAKPSTYARPGRHAAQRAEHAPHVRQRGQRSRPARRPGYRGRETPEPSATACRRRRVTPPVRQRPAQEGHRGVQAQADEVGDQHRDQRHRQRRGYEEQAQHGGCQTDLRPEQDALRDSDEVGRPGAAAGTAGP